MLVPIPRKRTLPGSWIKDLGVSQHAGIHWRMNLSMSMLLLALCR